MRFIVYGVGAIGGTVAGKLARAGNNVVGIARGAQLDAIKKNGLTIETPVGNEHADFPCHGSPSEITFADDDFVFLTMKTQDTPKALEDLRAAGVHHQPIFCFQNGVENERLALRIFPNVYGVCVIMPASFLKPGAVQAYGQPKTGIFDIGRMPKGTDAVCETAARALAGAGFVPDLHADIMRAKYGKLHLNLGNAIQASIGLEARMGPYFKAAQKEADKVFAAEGITIDDISFDNPRRDVMKPLPIGKGPKPGGSSWQSLARGSGVEADYLNGEIVLLGRLHGIPTPVNEYFVQLMHRMAAKGMKPGSMTEADVAAEMPLEKA